MKKIMVIFVLVISFLMIVSVVSGIDKSKLISPDEVITVSDRGDREYVANCADGKDNDKDGNIDLNGCDCDSDGVIETELGATTALRKSLCEAYPTELVNGNPGWCEDQAGVWYNRDAGCDDADDNTEGGEVIETIGFESFTDDVTSSGIPVDADSVRVAYSDNGNIVVVFSSDSSYSSGDGAIYYALYDSNGDNLVNPTGVADCVQGYQGNPDVTMNADGQFAIVWETDADSIRGDIYGELKKDSSGISSIVYENENNKACFNTYVGPRYGKGSSVWPYGYVDTHLDIAMKVFDSDGSVLVDESLVNNHDIFGNSYNTESSLRDNMIQAGLDNDYNPLIASYGNKFVVVWEATNKVVIESKSGIDDFSVYGKIYDFDGDEVEIDYDDFGCSTTTEICRGATGNEIPLFSDLATFKQIESLTAGVLESKEVFVAAWENYGIVDDESVHKPSLKAFSLDDGKPLSSGMNPLSDNNQEAFKDIAYDYKLAISDSNVVIAWVDAGEELNYMTYTQTSLVKDIGKSSINLKSGYCSYLLDVDSFHYSTAKKNPNALFSFASYKGTNCKDSYNQVSSSETIYPTYLVYDLKEDVEVKEVTMFSSIESDELPSVTASGSEQGYVLSYLSDSGSNEITYIYLDEDGEGSEPGEDVVTPTVGSSGTRGATTCAVGGCDCDGNRFVEEDSKYYYEASTYGAPTPSYCTGGDLCVDGSEGVWYSVSSEESIWDSELGCAEGLESYAGEAEFEICSVGGCDCDGNGYVDTEGAATTGSMLLCLNGNLCADGSEGTWYPEDASDVLYQTVGCSLGEEESPGSATEDCIDGIDNDGDGDIDGDDAGCDVSNYEWNRCGDGIDNDDDGYVDYPEDPECASEGDDSERDAGVQIFEGFSTTSEIRLNVQSLGAPSSSVGSFFSRIWAFFTFV